MVDFKALVRNWKDEVEAEAARLIEAGVAPFDAAIRAREIVSGRRRERVQTNMDRNAQAILDRLQ